MLFERISIEEKADIEFIEKLYIESFPRSERRPVLEMLDLIANEKQFVACILLHEGVRVGLFTYWDFDGFIFAEHFAIEPEYRSGGFGKLALAAVSENIKKPIVLEVELPEDEFSIRRINFYERNGFTKWDIPYMQPPYEPEEFDFQPLILMSLGDLDLNNESVYAKVKKDIYEIAYKCPITE